MNIIKSKNFHTCNHISIKVTLIQIKASKTKYLGPKKGRQELRRKGKRKYHLVFGLHPYESQSNFLFYF